jgi:hypothetical protein
MDWLMTRRFEPTMAHHPAALDRLSVLPVKRRPGQRRILLDPALVSPSKQNAPAWTRN